MVTVKQPFPIFTDAYFEHNVKLIRKYVKRIVQHHSTNVLHARKANVKFPPCTFAINFLSLFLPLETDRRAGANRCKSGSFICYHTKRSTQKDKHEIISFPFIWKCKILRQTCLDRQDCFGQFVDHSGFQLPRVARFWCRDKCATRDGKAFLCETITNQFLALT